MKKRILRKPSASLIIATTALVFSMAGTGYAVNQINGSQIKKGTIAGKALKKNTLTGTQINEAKLGKVPSAASADNAANAADAAKLAGADAAAYAKSANFVHVFHTMNAGDPDFTLVSNGDISVKMQCVTESGTDYLRVYGTTDNDGALLYGEGGDDTDPLDKDTPVTSSRISEGISGTAGFPAYDNGYDDTGFVINASNTRLITLLEGASTKILNRGGHTCIYGGTFVVEN